MMTIKDRYYYYYILNEMKQMEMMGNADSTPHSSRFGTRLIYNLIIITVLLNKKSREQKKNEEKL